MIRSRARGTEPTRKSTRPTQPRRVLPARDGAEHAEGLSRRGDLTESINSGTRHAEDRPEPSARRRDKVLRHEVRRSVLAILWPLFCPLRSMKMVQGRAARKRKTEGIIHMCRQFCGKSQACAETKTTARTTAIALSESCTWGVSPSGRWDGGGQEGVEPGIVNRGRAESD